MQGGCVDEDRESERETVDRSIPSPGWKVTGK